jgi:hypothetical protein
MSYKVDRSECVLYFTSLINYNGYRGNNEVSALFQRKFYIIYTFLQGVGTGQG